PAPALDAVVPPARVVPPVGMSVFRGPMFVVPVLGVAQIQALPVQPRGVPLPQKVPARPGAVPNPARIPPLNVAFLPGEFDPVDPAALQLRAKIEQLQASLLSEQAANKNDNEAKVKALKAEIEKLTKDLEKLQGATAQPGQGGNK